MSESIHLKLSQQEADLLLKSIETRQQEMADVHTSSGSTSAKMTEWETLDDLWQRIFDMGLDAGFGSSHKDARVAPKYRTIGRQHPTESKSAEH